VFNHVPLVAAAVPLRSTLHLAVSGGCAHHQAAAAFGGGRPRHLVSAGLADAMWTLSPKHEWDVAAGVGLVSSAGCGVCCTQNAKLLFNQDKTLLPGRVASSSGIWGQVLQLVFVSYRLGRVLLPFLLLPAFAASFALPSIARGPILCPWLALAGLALADPVLPEMGIHLTQVTTIGSVATHGRGGGGLSPDSCGTRISV
jgi:hypothetical protein